MRVRLTRVLVPAGKDARQILRDPAAGDVRHALDSALEQRLTPSDTTGAA